MIPEIRKLLILQHSDQKLRTLRLELVSIPAQRLASETAFAKASTQLSHIKTHSREIDLEANRLELDVQAKRAAIARYKQHQLQARKNEEYVALSHEILVAEAAILKIEERQLELMEEAEKSHLLLKAAQKNHTDERKKLETQLSKLAIRIATLEVNVRELEAAHVRLSAGIDVDLLDQYSRLFKSKNGQAVVPIEHDVCSGCHMKATPQIIVLVKSEKSITHCLQCGCILYLPQLYDPSLP
ncbi:Putative zinc ribbon domain protein [Candidatus Xiphinematobacter sp. Idaho Grape]|uniref:zinc ribbon domain-containing protein n=1 Tax=Candidatus Xiphinematobacter sp. Idaho Grape TaxID=1704307 RepID=UPI000706AF91|nr:C4-type zinc ribbon domain-containing protein [Candidatus Xiphinematobacter sp. Idaho Grape]ALJ56639.1 Putative zinc ribbon domain protein [Candidatus Xiphinematobacter sp. Idaho Grape]